MKKSNKLDAAGQQINPLEDDKIDHSKRKMGAAALAVTAAGLFGGLNKTGLGLINDVQAGEKKIDCWGINSCLGTTACTTAFNSCKGQNECEGKGFLRVSAKECKVKEGVPLKGSPTDPKKSKS